MHLRSAQDVMARTFRFDLVPLELSVPTMLKDVHSLHGRKSDEGALGEDVETRLGIYDDPRVVVVNRSQEGQRTEPRR